MNVQVLINKFSCTKEVYKIAIERRRIVGRIFRTMKKCFTTLHALVWSVHDNLAHVQHCITSSFLSAWFGVKECCNPQAALVRSAKNECVRTTVRLQARS